MSGLLDSLKVLKVWQVAVLALVLAGGGGGAYMLMSPETASGTPGLGADQQLVAVQIGDLRNEVSTNGSVVFPNTEAGRFGADGTVGEVLVEVGDLVSKGQVLATLDEASVTSLEKSLAQARVALQRAEDLLADALEPPTALAVAMAESKISTAARSLRNVEETLNDLLAPPDEADLIDARADIETTEIGLANALDEFSLSIRDWGRRVTDAEDTVVAARDDYGGVFNRWLGIQVPVEDLDNTVTELLDGWGADLLEIFDRDVDSLDVARGAFSSGPPHDRPETPWSEPTIYAWLNFYPGFIVVDCDDSFPEAQGSCIFREMEDAWELHNLSKETLEGVNALAAQALATSNTTVDRARDNLAASEDRLANLLEVADPIDIEVAERQLVVAQVTLVSEQHALVDLNADDDDVSIDLLRADIADASASLDSSIEGLLGTTLLAPFDGFVSAVNVAPGDIFRANTNQFAIEIIDPSEAEVDGIVDEIDVLFVSVGASATVTMDALPGVPLTGSVSSIDSVPSSQQGVVSYPIRIRIDLPPDLQLRSGLSATANIVIREDPGVLLIPTQTLRGSFNAPFVLVSTGAGLEERSIQLGNSDDFWVAVTDGLSEGEQVVMEMVQLAMSNNPFEVFRQAGGFGGGGFGSGRGGFGGGGGAGRPGGG